MANKKFTNKDKAEIVLRYMNGESYSAIARDFNVTHTTISKILKDKDLTESFKNIQEQSQMDMLAFIESKKLQAQHLISVILDSLEEKVKKAYLKDAVSSIEKLANIFNINKLGDLEDEKSITVVIKDCSKKENE